MKVVIALILIFFSVCAFTQPKLNVDSLQQLLTAAKDDTTRILLLAQISGEHTFNKPDSALAMGEKALDMSHQLNFKRGEIYSSTSLARFWWSMGDYSTALKFLLPITKTNESLEDPWLRIIVWTYITATYRDQGDYREALGYAAKFTSIEEKYDQCRLCRSCHTNTASIYLELDNVDSSIFYLHKAFTYPPVFGDDGWIFMIAGRAHAGKNNFDSAFYFYQQAIKTLILEDNQKDLAGTYNSMAIIFKKLSKTDSAFAYAQKALNIAGRMEYTKEFMTTSLLISKFHEGLNTDSALKYYKLGMSAKDTLFNQEKQRQIISYKFNEQLNQQTLAYTRDQYKSQLKIYALIAALILFATVAAILYRSNRNKQEAKVKIENAYTELKVTQAQLIQSEKMASLGELTAGIAHEIQNPLNFVNNFSEVNRELLVEMREEISKGNFDEVSALAKDVEDNQDKINEHGKRAESIVKGMLLHSRSSSGTKEPTDINKLADEYLRLSYHGFRAKDKSFNAVMETDYDQSVGSINVVPQEIGRVLLNLFNNAFYAVSEKKQHQREGYEPTVSVSTKRTSDKVVISVKDNGKGIPQKVIDKIFQPFFTTKPTGQGTGLGLSLAYDIVKAHGGEVKVSSVEGEFTGFILFLPI